MLLSKRRQLHFQNKKNTLLRNGDFMKTTQTTDTLLYFDPSYKTALRDFTKEMRHLKKSVAKKQQTLVFFCIGSDRATGDCLGPLVGHMLLQRFSNVKKHPHFLPRIYGTLENPVHALNLEKTLEHIQNTYAAPYVVAIDASLGIAEHVGYITYAPTPLIPGIGVQKKLPQVGDSSITGIVNRSGSNSHATLQTTHLSTVLDSASFIATGILNAYALTAPVRHEKAFLSLF